MHQGAGHRAASAQHVACLPPQGELRSCKRVAGLADWSTRPTGRRVRLRQTCTPWLGTPARSHGCAYGEVETVPLSYAFDFAGLKFEIHEQVSGPGAAPHLAMNTSLATRILGGGAEVLLEDPAGAGSLLTASWPVSGAEWDARAKDHDIPSPARVRLVCICAAIPQDQYTIASTTTPAATNHPEATAQLPAEYVLVGGGARADWPFGDPGSLLYASRPGVGESWYAASKDHVQASPATVTAFAIGVRRRFLDQFGLTVVRIEGDSVE